MANLTIGDRVWVEDPDDPPRGEAFSEARRQGRDHRHVWVEEQQTGHRVCGICNACDGRHVALRGPQVRGGG